MNTPVGIAALACNLTSVFYLIQKYFDRIWGIRLGIEKSRLTKIRDNLRVEVTNFVGWLGLKILVLVPFTLSVAN